ncbi:uncharacterized protein LOC142646266 isoform X2 [Dermatophagoides pteronyssinus]|uniref:uncharacterized protein LOC142646266 isoform X2 n=1 Tax=Dermatophagoides pteronyssinus TaxID=6956 RepID=UPI003F66C09C
MKFGSFRFVILVLPVIFANQNITENGGEILKNDSTKVVHHKEKPQEESLMITDETSHDEKKSGQEDEAEFDSPFFESVEVLKDGNHQTTKKGGGATTHKGGGVTTNKGGVVTTHKGGNVHTTPRGHNGSSKQSAFNIIFVALVITFGLIIV